MMKSLMIALCLTGAVQAADAPVGQGLQKGIYYAGHETSAFIPCGTKERWWLGGSEALLTELDHIYKANVHEDYGSLYLEAEGHFTRQAGNADYAGSFDTEKIVRVTVDDKVIESCVHDADDLK